jgi:hypothetical protein
MVDRVGRLDERAEAAEVGRAPAVQDQAHAQARVGAVIAEAVPQRLDGVADRVRVPEVDQQAGRQLTVMVSFSIQTAWVGESPFWPPSGVWPILSTVDCPETTLPNTA